MLNLTSLVQEYKQNKNKIILDRIFLELKHTVKQKSKFLYYQKWYPLSLYHKCKYCRNCNKLINTPKREHNLICKECDICKCVKGFFNLRNDNLCELEDIENDIWLEILRIIENYDITKDFNVYLFSCLWDFIPTFITKDFLKSLTNKSLTQSDEEGNETQIDIPENKEDENSKITMQEILKLCQTDLERKICELYLANPKLSQVALAKKLGTYQKCISRVLNDLRKRLKQFKK